jgi:hypothetical protein
MYLNCAAGLLISDKQIALARPSAHETRSRKLELVSKHQPVVPVPFALKYFPRIVAPLGA